MDELVLNWTKELQWEDNPFKKQFLEPIEKTIGGYEKERQKLNLFLLNELPFGTIIGAEGMGKTLLIKWFTSQLDRHPEKFIYTYLDKKQLADTAFIQNICSPFTKKHSLAKLFKKEEKITRKNIQEYLQKNIEHKHFLIIIDDANLLSKEDIETLEQVRAPKVQIILAGKSFEKMNLKAFDKDNLGIDIKKMDFASGRDMLKKRIESVGGSDIWPFTDKIIKDIFGLGDYNPKKILTLCQERAKELAIEVKQGKIKHPEHRLIKIEHEVQEISYQDHPVEHPAVEKKHKDDGFAVKFTFKDDDEAKAMEEMAAPEETDEQESEGEEGTEKKAKKETKSQEKKEEKAQEEKPAKKEEKMPEKEERQTKKENAIIDINLGYEEKPKKEAKPMKIEAFEIDIKPKKKK